MQRVLPPAVLFFLALWFILLVGGRSRFFQDPSTFRHLVVGDQILNSRGFFTTDQFSFTFAGQPWIPHEWLSEVAMSLAHRLGGLDTVLLLAVTLLSVIFAWLAARLIRFGGLHPSLAAIGVALAFAASAGHFQVTPHLATIACFAVLLVLLCNYEAGRGEWTRLLWLIPLFAIWSNMHSGVLGGLATFAFLLIGWVIAWKLGWDTPIYAWKQVPPLAALWFACAGTAFLNPYGVDLPHSWLTLYQMKSIPALMNDRVSVSFSDPTTWLFVLLGLGYLILLWGIQPPEIRLSWFIPLLWLSFALLRVQCVPLFAVAALVIAADLFPQTNWASQMQESGSDFYQTPPDPPKPTPWNDRLVAFVLPTLCIGVAVGLQTARIPVPIIGREWVELDRSIWPVELLEELKVAQKAYPEGTRIFNEYHFGGYLIYHTPGFRVFVDDRYELYGYAWLAEYVQDVWIDPPTQFRHWEEQHGSFDYALVAGAPSHVDERFTFDGYFRHARGWTLVKRTATAVLYKRE